MIASPVRGIAPVGLINWGLGRLLTHVLIAMVCGTWATFASARFDLDTIGGEGTAMRRGIHIMDGSYVMTANNLQVNITNHGLIGSQFTETLPYSHAPSAQWPAGSGIEYLWSGGLWVGGSINNSVRVSTGQFEREFRPQQDIWSTIYEARNQTVIRPSGMPNTGGRRVPDINADDDHDGRRDEETLNGRDDDGDGRIEEDFGQIGDQMMVCTMYDNTLLSRETYPEHEPLGLKVVQTSAAFQSNDFDDFVVLRYEVTNIGTADIDDLRLGFFADCDIGPRGKISLQNDDQIGFFEGVVRSSNDSWSYLRVGYMYDAGDDPVPGYIGISGVGNRGFRNYRYFHGNRTFQAGGLPLDDQQRYTAMTRAQPAEFYGTDPQDYSILMSTGGLEVFEPGQTTVLNMALVMGNGLQEMLVNCANADVVMGGAYFDLDGDTDTGTRGRETKLCFPAPPPSWDSIYSQSAMHMQNSCVGENISPYPTIRPTDFTQQENGSYCIWVNYDNCDECTRIAGVDCTNDWSVFWQYWNCWDRWLPAAERIGCTGIAGRESIVPWFEARIPPPSPGLRVWPQDKSVHIYWDDESEYAVDFELEMIDFESYQIWRSDNWERPLGTSTATGPDTGLWQQLTQYDIVDDMVIPVRQGVNDTIPLGENTGLEVASYRPACLDNPAYEGLQAAMQAVVDLDTEGLYSSRPNLRDGHSKPIPGFEPLLPWETYPTVLDTFFDVAARPAGPGVNPKRGRKYYEYVDREVHNGFLYFYSVTAADRIIKVQDSQPMNLGPGISGSPGNSFTFATPSTDAQTPTERQQMGTNIYVFPNPATIDAFADFQQLEPSRNDPTGVRITFANLPRAHNRIRIYTASGDLVKELSHDGTNGYGQESWNLISRNGQEIASGIYLYSVVSDREGFSDFIGRFVVIR